MNYKNHKSIVSTIIVAVHWPQYISCNETSKPKSCLPYSINILLQIQENKLQKCVFDTFYDR